MKFVKMHGIGNDYVYVDLFHERLPEPPEALAVKVSKPHFGVGADGLILIMPSAACDAAMRVFNADGSEALMCGNGVRCVGKYLYDSGLCRKDMIRVDTKSGVKVLAMRTKGGVATGATVDMGVPAVAPALDLEAAGERWTLTPVSVGNPHAVCFLNDLPGDDLFARAGAALEKHPAFADGANIEFARVLSESEIEMRVWERGSGETLACGTGACAVLCAAVHRGLCGRSALVRLKGGALDIEWRADGRVYMTGPACTVYTGEWRET